MWRDPRLAVGLLLVAGSVVTGASLAGDSDTGIPVLAAGTDLVAGSRLDADDVTPVNVRFVTEAAADRYVLADGGLPADAVLTRGVEAGELLPRSALGAADGAGFVEVPVPVHVERVPEGVRPGAVVDVWVAGEQADPGRLLAGKVVVRSASRSGAGSGVQRVVVAVPADQDETVAQLVAHARPDAVLIVLREG